MNGAQPASLRLAHVERLARALSPPDNLALAAAQAAQAAADTDAHVENAEILLTAAAPRPPVAALAAAAAADLGMLTVVSECRDNTFFGQLLLSRVSVLRQIFRGVRQEAPAGGRSPDKVASAARAAADAQQKQRQQQQQPPSPHAFASAALAASVRVVLALLRSCARADAALLDEVLGLLRGAVAELQPLALADAAGPWAAALDALAPELWAAAAGSAPAMAEVAALALRVAVARGSAAQLLGVAARAARGGLTAVPPRLAAVLGELRPALELTGVAPGGGAKAKAQRSVPLPRLEGPLAVAADAERGCLFVHSPKHGLLRLDASSGEAGAAAADFFVGEGAAGGGGGSLAVAAGRLYFQPARGGGPVEVDPDTLAVVNPAEDQDQGPICSDGRLLYAVRGGDLWRSDGRVVPLLGPGSASSGAAAAVAINCGGPAVTGPDGTAFEADRGHAGSSDGAVHQSGAGDPLQSTMRVQPEPFEYVLPDVAPGAYVLRIMCGDLGQGATRFDVVVNGRTVAANFDGKLGSLEANCHFARAPLRVQLRPTARGALAGLCALELRRAEPGDSAPAALTRAQQRAVFCNGQQFAAVDEAGRTRLFCAESGAQLAEWDAEPSVAAYDAVDNCFWAHDAGARALLRFDNDGLGPGAAATTGAPPDDLAGLVLAHVDRLSAPFAAARRHSAPREPFAYELSARALAALRGFEGLEGHWPAALRIARVHVAVLSRRCGVGEEDLAAELGRWRELLERALPESPEAAQMLTAGLELFYPEPLAQGALLASTAAEVLPGGAGAGEGEGDCPAPASETPETPETATKRSLLRALLGRFSEAGTMAAYVAQRDAAGMERLLQLLLAHVAAETHRNVGRATRDEPLEAALRNGPLRVLQLLLTHVLADAKAHEPFVLACVRATATRARALADAAADTLTRVRNREVGVGRRSVTAARVLAVVGGSFCATLVHPLLAALADEPLLLPPLPLLTELLGALHRLTAAAARVLHPMTATGIARRKLGKMRPRHAWEVLCDLQATVGWLGGRCAASLVLGQGEEEEEQEAGLFAGSIADLGVVQEVARTGAVAADWDAVEEDEGAAAWPPLLVHGKNAAIRRAVRAVAHAAAHLAGVDFAEAWPAAQKASPALARMRHVRRCAYEDLCPPVEARARLLLACDGGGSASLDDAVRTAFRVARPDDAAPLAAALLRARQRAVDRAEGLAGAVALIRATAEPPRWREGAAEMPADTAVVQVLRHVGHALRGQRVDSGATEAASWLPVDHGLAGAGAALVAAVERAHRELVVCACELARGAADGHPSPVSATCVRLAAVSVMTSKPKPAGGLWLELDVPGLLFSLFEWTDEAKAVVEAASPSRGADESAAEEEAKGEPVLLESKSSADGVGSEDSSEEADDEGEGGAETETEAEGEGEAEAEAEGEGEDDDRKTRRAKRRARQADRLARAQLRLRIAATCAFKVLALGAAEAAGDAQLDALRARCGELLVRQLGLLYPPAPAPAPLLPSPAPADGSLVARSPVLLLPEGRQGLVVQRPRGMHGDFTLAMWVHLVAVSPGATHVLFAKGNFDRALPQATVSGSSRKLSLHCAVGDDTLEAVAATPLPLGEWVHVAFARRGAALFVFVNGRQDNVDDAVVREEVAEPAAAAEAAPAAEEQAPEEPTTWTCAACTFVNECGADIPGFQISRCVICGTDKPAASQDPGDSGGDSGGDDEGEAPEDPKPSDEAKPDDGLPLYLGAPPGRTGVSAWVCDVTLASEADGEPVPVGDAPEAVVPPVQVELHCGRHGHKLLRLLHHYARHDAAAPLPLDDETAALLARAVDVRRALELPASVAQLMAATLGDALVGVEPARAAAAVGVGSGGDVPEWILGNLAAAVRAEEGAEPSALPLRWRSVGTRMAVALQRLAHGDAWAPLVSAALRAALAAGGAEAKAALRVLGVSLRPPAEGEAVRLQPGDRAATMLTADGAVAVDGSAFRHGAGAAQSALALAVPAAVAAAVAEPLAQACAALLRAGGVDALRAAKAVRLVAGVPECVAACAGLLPALAGLSGDADAAAAEAPLDALRALAFEAGLFSRPAPAQQHQQQQQPAGAGAFAVVRHAASVSGHGQAGRLERHEDSPFAGMFAAAQGAPWPPAGKCSFATTQREPASAPAYECRTCQLERVCAACAAACHAGHEVVWRGRAGAFWCRCGPSAGCCAMATDYVEVAVGSRGEGGAVGVSVGLAPASCVLDDAPQTFYRSDGAVRLDGDDVASWGEFADGDVVGMGCDWLQQRVFFTLNGRLLGAAFDCAPGACPTVWLSAEAAVTVAAAPCGVQLPPPAVFAARSELSGVFDNRPFTVVVNERVGTAVVGHVHWPTTHEFHELSGVVSLRRAVLELGDSLRLSIDSLPLSLSGGGVMSALVTAAGSGDELGTALLTPTPVAPTLRFAPDALAAIPAGLELEGDVTVEMWVSYRPSSSDVSSDGSSGAESASVPEPDSASASEEKQTEAEEEGEEEETDKGTQTDDGYVELPNTKATQTGEPEPEPEQEQEQAQDQEPDDDEDTQYLFSHAGSRLFLRIDEKAGALEAGGAACADTLRLPLGARDLRGHWFHVALRCEGSTWTLLRNGREERQAEGAPFSAAAGGAWAIGARPDGARSLRGGSVHEVRLWAAAQRTREDIQWRLWDSVSGLELGLVGAWPCAEGVGSTAFDLSRGARHAELAGCEWAVEGAAAAGAGAEEAEQATDDGEDVMPPPPPLGASTPTRSRQSPATPTPASVALEPAEETKEEDEEDDDPPQPQDDDEDDFSHVQAAFALLPPAALPAALEPSRGVAPLVFDPRALPEDMSLSNGGRTVANEVGSGWRTAIGSEPVFAGRHAWTVRVDAVANNEVMVGLAPDASLATGNCGSCVAYYGCGFSYSEGASTAFGEKLFDGDTVTVEADMDARVVGFYRNERFLGRVPLPAGAARQLFPAVSGPAGTAATITGMWSAVPREWQWRSRFAELGVAGQPGQSLDELLGAVSAAAAAGGDGDGGGDDDDVVELRSAPRAADDGLVLLPHGELGQWRTTAMPDALPAADDDKPAKAPEPMPVGGPVWESALRSLVDRTVSQALGAHAREAALALVSDNSSDLGEPEAVLRLLRAADPEHAGLAAALRARLAADAALAAAVQREALWCLLRQEPVTPLAQLQQARRDDQAHGLWLLRQLVAAGAAAVDVPLVARVVATASATQLVGQLRADALHLLAALPPGEWREAWFVEDKWEHLVNLQPPAEPCAYGAACLELLVRKVGAGAARVAGESEREAPAARAVEAGVRLAALAPALRDGGPLPAACRARAVAESDVDALRVAVESAHPYNRGQPQTGRVSLPAGARAAVVQFAPECAAAPQDCVELSGVWCGPPTGSVAVDGLPASGELEWTFPARPALRFDAAASSGLVEVPTQTPGKVRMAASYQWVVAVTDTVVSAGRLRWQVTVERAADSDIMVGVVQARMANTGDFLGSDAAGWGFHGASRGKKFHDGEPADYGCRFGQGDEIQAELDMDAGTLEFFVNGDSQGVAFDSGLQGKELVPAVALYSAGDTVSVRATSGAVDVEGGWGVAFSVVPTCLSACDDDDNNGGDVECDDWAAVRVPEGERFPWVGVPDEAERRRVHVLWQLNRDVEAVLPMLDLSAAGPGLGRAVVGVRELVAPRVKLGVWREALAATTTQQARPSVTVDRLAGSSLLRQVQRALRNVPVDALRQSGSMFMASLAGERAQDAGGVSRELFTCLADEIRAGLPADADADLCRFVGLLLGAAMRTGIGLGLQWVPEAWAELPPRVREGLGAVVPLPLVELFTPAELEELVCGPKVVDVALWRRSAVYRSGFAEPQIGFLWDVIENRLDEDERRRLLRFVYGRSTLPAPGVGAALEEKFQVHLVASKGDADLPSAHTCFFQLELPPYSSAHVMEERLRYAVEACAAIDADE